MSRELLEKYLSAEPCSWRDVYAKLCEDGLVGSKEEFWDEMYLLKVRRLVIISHAPDVRGILVDHLRLNDGVGKK